MQDRARRFISLVDELYDRRMSLVILAAALPTGLYPQGPEAFEFRHPRNRREKIRTREYYHCGHLG